ncbi:MAG: hypothetical protein JWO86_3115 [Myxococcaceae bacterium]|nr:hypothetical protein [Myxococcaceae bacterium]
MASVVLEHPTAAHAIVDVVTTAESKESRNPVRIAERASRLTRARRDGIFLWARFGSHAKLCGMYAERRGRPLLARARARAFGLAVAFALGLAGCGAALPVAHPDVGARAKATSGGSTLRPAPSAEAAAVSHAEPRPVDPSLITHGTRAAVFARDAVPPATPLCTKPERRALTFDPTPTYTEKVEKDGSFSARLFVGNDAPCTRKIAVPLSFTPPRTTTTRTVDFAAYVPPRGAFVELRLEPRELAEIDVRPGRYAITFSVLDEEGGPVGHALAGNAFRLGRDDVALTTSPALPARIGAGEDLVVPFAIENVGDSSNRVTPLVVFTRPGETKGIEHYDPPQVVLPGTSTYVLRLTALARETERIAPGSWLVTVTMFDAAGDRLNSFAGLPLTIGSIDLRMTRPELPARVRAGAALHATFKLENHGDTKDRITAIVTFTKPGTTNGREFVFTRDVPPGPLAFDAVIEPAQRQEKGVDKGVWLVSTAAFRSSGERIKSFTGHYLEIVE